MTSDFITPDDSRWNDFLDRVPHDFYQTPEYLAFCGRFEGGVPLAFWAEENSDFFLLPLLKRNLPDILDVSSEWSDAASPYGYPSLLITPGADLSCTSRFLNKFVDSARELNLVSVFLRLHPLFEAPHHTLELLGRLVRHGQTVNIDLLRPIDELRRDTRSNHRRGIKKLQWHGFQVILDDWQYFPEFARVYRLTMERVEADQYYFFNDDYFRGLKESLQKHLHLCAVLSPTGELSAACLFTTCGHIIQYHLGGTSPAFLSEAPSKLMFDAIRTWGKDAGYHYFHLGGGLGAGEDSLFHFKSGFSTERRDFFTYRLIVDEEKYQSCVHSWEKTHLSNQTIPGDFFPTYRRP